MLRLGLWMGLLGILAVFLSREADRVGETIVNRENY